MEKFKYLKKSEITRLPTGPGVYAFRNGGQFLYIGKAANIRERVKNHFQQPTYRNNLFIDQVSKIGYLKTDSEIEALILEANLIKKYQPKYNIVWRDDKNYFYVAVSNEDFPRIFITHQPISVNQHSNQCKSASKSRVPVQYLGPFVDGKSLKAALKSLRKVFPYRSCRTIPNRPCLWYHLEKCSAPCLLKSKMVKEIPVDSLKIKRVSQRNARNLTEIIRKGKNPVLKELKREMKKAAKKQEFEEAAKIRDQIRALERILSHAKIFEPPLIIQKENWPRIQKVWQKILKTTEEISRIEAYDISNIQGQEATGSMVTFINGQPDKNFYRRFKIKVTGKPNDIAMLKECLNRRSQHSEWGLPDLVLVDGGKAQLRAAQCSRCHFKPKMIMALAKKENKLFVEGQKKPILLEDLPREIFNLILQLRDEAHRFAKKYHHKLREIDLRESIW